MEFIKEASPHIRRKDSTVMMMADVLIGLSPVVIFALLVYTWAAVRNILLSVLVMCLAEFVFVLIMNKMPDDGKKHTFKEKLIFKCKKYKLSNFIVPAVSGVIYGLLTPAAFDYSYWAYITIIFGALFGMIIGKLVFGGTGRNIFNPAAVGFIFSKICFGDHYRVANYSSWLFPDLNEIGATFLKLDFTQTTLTSNGVAYNLYESYSLLDLCIGNIPGLMGETCKIAILIGLIYLLVRRTIDWRIVVGYLGSFLFYMAIAGIIVSTSINTNINFFSFVAYQFLSGGLLFGAVFMATDPVTSPITKPSRWLYGIILGSITVIIRLYGSPIGDDDVYIHEGVAYAILIGNMLAPVLDYYKWSSNSFKKSNVIPLIVTPLAVSLIIIWATLHIAFNETNADNTITISPTQVENAIYSLKDFAGVLLWK